MIEYRLTPWDTKTFGFKTAEITTIQFSENFSQELKTIEEELKQKEVKFVYTRIDGQDFQLKKILQDFDYYFAESSLTLFKNKLQSFEKQKQPKIKLETFKSSDIDSIKNMARDSFNFGRFHEDANIDSKLSKARYYNWIDDLLSQKATIQTAKLGDKLVGFNIQKEDIVQLETNITLTGCGKGFELYVLSLWNEILEYNKIQGIRKVRTLISTANIGVLNVYSYFGFKVEKTLFGFHKWL